MISNEKEFWTVGFSQWGRWQVRKAPVDQPDSYTLVEDLGPELKAAYLEADGDFVYVAGQEHISLITSGVPWLFVITTSGKLYVKKVAEPLDTAILLDTDVEEACACRGWKSNRYSVDDGLIIAYRKRVGAFIRAYHPIQGTYVWDDVQIISARQVSHIEIRRLNDFRIGILLDRELLLTNRTYIGSTVKTEFFDDRFNSDLVVMSMTATTGPKADFTITGVVLKDLIELWVTGNYPFYKREEVWNDLSITTQVVAGQGIDRYWVEDGYLKIRLKLPMTTPYAYMRIHLRALNRIQFERTPQSRPVCPELDIIYEAPPVPVDEHFDASWSSPNTAITMIQKRNLVYNGPEEHFADSWQSPAVGFTLVEVVRIINRVPAEHFDVAASSPGSAITMIQSGVTPI